MKKARSVIILSVVVLFLLFICVLARPQKVAPVIKFPSSVGEVRFPHYSHFSDYDVNCKTCHHETDAKKLNIPHKDYFKDFWIKCETCHHEKKMARIAISCSHCHKLNIKNAADETLSLKVVIHKNCWECHEVENGETASKNCKFCHSGTPNNT